MSLEGKTSKLILDIIARDKASATLRKLGVATDGSVDKMKALHTASNAAAAGLAAWGAIALASVKNAAEDEAAQRKLALSIQNVTGASQEQVAAVEDQIYQMELMSGVSDDQLRPAMNRLVISTGDVEESQKLLNVALDASVATGKDVGTVALALGKAYNGNAASLGRLGFAYKDQQGNLLTFQQILENVTKATQGQAEAAGNAEPWKKFQVSVDEAKEAVGGALLPAVKAGTEALNRLGPQGIQAAFVITGVGLAAVALPPRIYAAKKALDAMNVSFSGLGKVGLRATAALAGVDAIMATFYHAPDVQEPASWSARLTKDSQAVEDFGNAIDAVDRGGFVGTLSRGITNLAAALPGVDNPLDTATADFQNLDTALSDLVKSGNAERAQANYQVLVDRAKEMGYTQSDVNELLPQYAQSLALTTTQLGKTALTTRTLTKAEADLLSKTQDAANAFGDLQQSLITIHGDERTFIEDLKKSNGHIFGQGKAVEQTRSDFLQWTNDIRDHVTKMDAAGRSTEAQTGYLKAQKEHLKEVASRLGILNGHLRHYIDNLLRIPKHVNTTVTVNGSATLPSGNYQGKSVPTSAAGGYAAGGYMRWVGEYGPELLNTRTGYVTPHSQTMGRGTGGGDTFIIHGALDPDSVAAQIDEMLTQRRRRNGRLNFASVG